MRVNSFISKNAEILNSFMHGTVIFTVIFDEYISDYPHSNSLNTDEIKHLPLELKNLIQA